MSSEDRLLTVREAAEFLQLSRFSLYHFVSQHRVPVIKLSRRCIRFSQAALRAWVESLSQAPETSSYQRRNRKAKAVMPKKEILV